MTTQYLRKASLVVSNASGAGLDLSQLQFRFLVMRGDLQTPNTADIRVYNVSDQTFNSIQKEFTQVTLQAGYQQGNFGIIFNGTIKQIRRGRENATDTYIDITAADGDGAYNFAVVNTSLAAGATPAQQVAAIAQSMDGYNVTQGTLSGLSSQALPRGKVLFGMARSHLRNIANTSQVSWSIQNGQITTVPLDNFVPNETVVITAATGMIGLPEQAINGIKVRILLNPNIKIGGSLQIDNKSIQQLRFGVDINSAALNPLLNAAIHLNADGIYKVLWVDYFGDTRGNEWYAEITCVAIDAVLGPQYLNKSSGLGPANPAPPVNPYG